MKKNFIKQGWLDKKRLGNNSWDCRWFVLRDKELFFYKGLHEYDSSYTAKEPKIDGIIPLMTCEVSLEEEDTKQSKRAPKDNTPLGRIFSISTEIQDKSSKMRKKIKILLMAQSPEDRQSWMESIEKSRDFFSMSSGPDSKRKITGKLRIVVLSAKELKSRDLLSKSDPCVTIFLDEQILKTQIVKKSQNPKFTEEFNLLLYTLTSEIHFMVYDDKLSKDSFLGQAKIPLAELQDEAEHDKWFKLQPRTIANSEKVGGELHILFKFSKPTESDLYTPTQVFGVPLSIVLSRPDHQGESYPIVARKCIECLQNIGLKSEGLFRVPGNAGGLKELQARFDQGHGKAVDVNRYDINVVAGLLKLYLRELPEPLLTFALYDSFRQPIEDVIARVEHFYALVEQLPPQNKIFLKNLVQFLKNVADYAATNMMTPANLALVFGTNLLRAEGKELESALSTLNVSWVIEFLIEQYSAIFEGGQYVPPPPKESQPASIDPQAYFREQNNDDALMQQYAQLRAQESNLAILPDDEVSASSSGQKKSYSALRLCGTV